MSENELTFLWLTLTAAFVLYAVSVVIIRRRQKFPRLRSIQAYEKMPGYINHAIESDRPVHISIGASGIGGETTLTTLASTEIIYHMMQKQAVSNQLPVITLSDPISLAIVQDTVRKAFISQKNLAAYRGSAVLWYPSSERSLAMGVGIAVLAGMEKSPASIVTGEFGSEIAFVGEASRRLQKPFIGQSTQLEGQAIAFAMSDYPLIGEELFVSRAYFNPASPSAISSVIVLDMLRWITVGIIIIAVLLNITD